MKTTLTLLILFLCLNSQAQYQKKDAIIGASMLGVTFASLEIYGDKMTYGQRSITAMSGIAISAGYSLFKTTKFSRKIQHRIKMNRNKKINYKPLICEKWNILNIIYIVIVAVVHFGVKMHFFYNFTSITFFRHRKCIFTPKWTTATITM